jgi:uncharacterized protein (DUF1778 family)
MPDYLIRGIDAEFWKQVKAAAALEGQTIKDFVLEALKDRMNEIKQKEEGHERS